MEKPTGLAAWRALHARLTNLGRSPKKGPSRGVGDLWRRIQEQIQGVLCLPRVLTNVQDE